MWNRDGCKEGGRGEMRQEGPQCATDDMPNFIYVSRHLRVVSLSEKSVTLSHYVEHPPKLAPFLQSLNNNNVHVSSPKNLNEVH